MEILVKIIFRGFAPSLGQEKVGSLRAVGDVRFAAAIEFELGRVVYFVLASCSDVKISSLHCIFEILVTALIFFDVFNILPEFFFLNGILMNIWA